MSAAALYEPRQLSIVSTSFLGSNLGTRVLVGDPGSGKSTFLWHFGQQLLAGGRLDDILDTPVPHVPDPCPVVAIPLYIELKRHSVDSVWGLLDRCLREAGLSAAAIEALKGQDPSCPLVRVVALVDGLDELKGDLGSVRDVVSEMCGGVVWPPSLLAMVVTSRESCIGDRGREVELFGEEYTRALLLPFTKQRVSG